MLLRLLLLMTVVPILELVIIINIHGTLAGYFGSARAIFVTIGSILLTGVIGANLAKSQGFQLLSRIQGKLASQEVPGIDLVEGAMVLVGGVLLITPGYFTDLVGFLLLIPWSRQILCLRLQKWFSHQVEKGSVSFSFGGTTRTGQTWQPPKQQNPDVIDIEAEDHSKTEGKG